MSLITAKGTNLVDNIEQTLVALLLMCYCVVGWQKFWLVALLLLVAFHPTFLGRNYQDGRMHQWAIILRVEG